MTSAPAPSPSPASRLRATRRRVHATDALASAIITLGGIGVLVAVLGICVYLFFAVLPLFDRGTLGEASARRIEAPAAVAFTHVDEYRQLLLVVSPAGEMATVHLPTGRVLDRRAIGRAGAEITSFSWVVYEDLLALGYADGTVQLGTIRFETAQRVAEAVPPEARSAEIGASVPLPAGGGEGGGEDGPGPGAVVQRVRAEQFRAIWPVVELREPVTLSEGSGPPVAIDYRRAASEEFMAVARADGTVLLDQVTTIRPLGGGKPRSRLTTSRVAFVAPEGRGVPDRLYVTGDGAHVLALWDDGVCQRYGVGAAGADGVVPLVETVDLLEPGRRVTVSGMMLGGLTLLVGDDAGRLHGAFAGRVPAQGTVDGLHLVRAHTLEVSDRALVALGLSHRNRTVLVGDEGGGVSAWNVTARKLAASAPAGFARGGEAIAALALAPKFDAAVALGTGGSYEVRELDAPHPEASFSSLFGRVHYEGEGEPVFSYQSSSASDSAEPKLSLRPLIHGTLKATVVAMLFAAPLAVLAAIYTSEFLSPRTRNTIKPAIEMMASLPSVVLGFVAAIIVAPFVNQVLPAVLLGLVVVPLVLLVGAHLWQMLPTRAATRLRGGWRTVAIGVFLAGGAGLASVVGPAVERALFVPTRSDQLVLAGFHEAVERSAWPSWVGARRFMSPDDERRLRAQGLYFRDGAVVRPAEPRTDEERARLASAIEAQGLGESSLRRWLDGNIGAPHPGWVLVLFAPVAIAVWAAQARLVGRAQQNWMRGVGPLAAAVFLLAKLVVLLAASAAATWALAGALASTGLDTRDLVFGPYNQRNTLIVGIIMGFAVIPIIYTISEDAMSSVPASLRSASMGSGATPWQTAVRIVLPVAASGIFSAIMIGLGRAVGETMIVVMATGNTASMDWNLFSGFRTLSANIAVELPEAAKDSTHYRVLFLCGLVLFVMTFAVNTTAELVRQHFRRRNAAL